MEAARPLPRFAMAVHVYMWLFFVLLGFVPLFVTSTIADRLPLSSACWIAAWTWPLSITILAFYTHHQYIAYREKVIMPPKDSEISDHHV